VPVIVGEPTEMRVVSGHKGCFEYSTQFTGVEGHGSRPDAGVNAVEYAALLVRELMDIAASLKSRPPQGSPFDPPWTTLSVGRIAGGIAHNVIPNRCTVDWEFRPVDAADADYVKRRVDDYVAATLLPAMRAAGAATDAADIGIATVIVGEVAGLAPEPRSPAVDLMTRLTGRNDVGVVAFGTEAGLFQAQGISTVVCGPGSIAQAHRPDEFIGLDQMQACLDVLQRLIASQSA
jgi:acetylornithine deacetylase